MRLTRWFRLPFLLLLLALPWGSGQLSGAVQEQGEVISRTWHDVNGDGKKEQIEIILKDGERYRDTEPWCGSGDKWEGFFLIRVVAGEQVLSEKSLNRLMYPGEEPPEALFFWGPPFTLEFGDYNDDGQPDFNLGQYGSCNGNVYRIFTIDRNGEITRLPIQGSTGFFISPGNRLNSTRLLYASKGTVLFSYYDNVEARKKAGRYRWDGTQFVPEKHPKKGAGVERQGSGNIKKSQSRRGGTKSKTLSNTK